MFGWNKRKNEVVVANNNDNRPVKITHYIGWITDNGVVIPAKPKQSEARLKALEFEYNKMIEHQRELEEKRKAASEKRLTRLLATKTFCCWKH